MQGAATAPWARARALISFSDWWLPARAGRAVLGDVAEGRGDSSAVTALTVFGRHWRARGGLGSRCSGARRFAARVLVGRGRLVEVGRTQRLWQTVRANVQRMAHGCGERVCTLARQDSVLDLQWRLDDNTDGAAVTVLT